MKEINVSREHTMTSEDCGKLVENIAGWLVDKIGGSYDLRADGADYKHRSGAKGTLTFDDNKISVNVNLPLLMRPMAGMIQGEIEKKFDEHVS